MTSSQTIPSWYKGKNIFITGGTGFVGICLIEKLLRVIPETGDIYLLMRPKKGKEISDRLEDIKKNLIFEKVLETRSPEQVFSKLKAIAGDVAQPNLGLSEADRKILTEKINVIFHSAATLDFAEGLRETVNVNLLGTRRVLELANQCRNLNAYIHVSSAYVNSYNLKAEEIIYPLKEDPEGVISLVEKMDDEKLEKMTPDLLGDHPNTYTFTKHMAEHEVKKSQTKFSCAIVRPSMIVGAWKEPIPGWTISKNGPQGFLMGASKGVVRRLPVGKELVYDYIPVDIVVNTLIAAGFHAGSTNAKEVEVYQCTSSTRNPFRWIAVDDKVNDYLHKYPLKSAVWYPHLKFLPSVTWFKISALFVHFLPAFILDTITRLVGGRPILMRLHRNVNSSLDRLEKFIFTEWEFPAEKTDKLHNWLSSADQQAFNLDISSLVWPDYFDYLTQGARRYLSNEKMSNISSARSKDTILRFLHFGLQVAIYALIWYLVACITGKSMKSASFIVPVAYILFSFL
ncbi:putative fatty acyl-CoA reductase CG8306 [Agrilus planipennis]|uniref:Fatty acyl-CoA reductase n=1 Tax=Agrilus planipennis TaxID=224129 RepID=A0A1W4WDB7_AGRPL|nr:putative fatty acyl-CoA reductase CG8306 [Agrilus planipennis]